VKRASKAASKSKTSKQRASAVSAGPCASQSAARSEMPPKKKRKVEPNKLTQETKQGKTENKFMILTVLSTITVRHANIAMEIRGNSVYNLTKKNIPLCSFIGGIGLVLLMFNKTGWSKPGRGRIKGLLLRPSVNACNCWSIPGVSIPLPPRVHLIWVTPKIFGVGLKILRCTGM